MVEPNWQALNQFMAQPEPPADDLLKVFICDDHDGFYPVGTASVIIARNEAHARSLLDEQLIASGLKPSSEDTYTLTEIAIDIPAAHIIRNGDY